VAGPDRYLRASDAEREQVIEDLRQHAADGRLTMDEFEQRVAEALAATTRGDLEPVLRELPALERAPQSRPRARRQVRLPSGRAVLIAAAVVFAVIMTLQGMWWIIFPLMGVLGGGSGRCASKWSGHDHRTRHRAGSADLPDERELIRV
jgi:hypothetical protein